MTPKTLLSLKKLQQHKLYGFQVFFSNFHRHKNINSPKNKNEIMKDIKTHDSLKLCEIKYGISESRFKWHQ